MVPEFDKVAFASVGTYTKEPVQSQFGWHVKVEDKRAKQPPAFDEVKDQARQARSATVLCDGRRCVPPPG